MRSTPSSKRLLLAWTPTPPRGPVIRLGSNPRLRMEVLTMSRKIITAAIAGVSLVVLANASNAEVTATNIREKADQITQELRAKVDAAEQHLKDAMSSAKISAEKARIQAKSQLEMLEGRAKADFAKVQEDAGKAKAWLEQKKATTEAQFAEWKAKHDAARLAAYADGAEQYVAYAAERAAAAIEEVERAAIEAILARSDANEAASAVK